MTAPVNAPVYMPSQTVECTFNHPSAFKSCSTNMQRIGTILFIRPQLGRFASFTPIMQPSASNYSHKAGGPVYYNPQMQGKPAQSLPQAVPYAFSAPSFVSSIIPQPHHFASYSYQSSSGPIIVQDLKDVLTVTRKNSLPQWKLAKYNGDSLHW